MGAAPRPTCGEPGLRGLVRRGGPAATLVILLAALATDLPQFLHRRELATHEQRLARAGYAYGVDLRRATQLATSMFGDPLMRAVDRRWSATVAGLEDDSLLPLRKAPPTAVLEELTTLITLLRAPLPTVRLLRPDPRGTWPIVTPLGTTKGAISWLVIDPVRIMKLSPAQRTFVLASGLAHLQCDHGPVFSAFVMASRGERVGLVKTVLRPWARVATFSSDRAALLALRSLDDTLAAIAGLTEQPGAEASHWLPRAPSVEHRTAALTDFDRAEIMVRRRLLSDPDGGGWNLAPVGSNEGSALLRRIRAAFGIWTRPQVGGGPPPAAPDSADEKAGEQSGDASGKAKGNPADTEAADSPPTASEAPEPRPIDPQTASALEQALADAWSLARCDARLTRRLKLP